MPRTSRYVLALAAVAWLLATHAAHADTTTIVAPGENLYQIATRYGTTVDALVAHNGLASADRIFAGQRLVVPGESAGPSISLSAVGIYQASSSASTVIVGRGDTLSGIARRYGTSARAIAAANGLASLDSIFAGQQLAIPGGLVPAGLGVGGPVAVQAPVAEPISSATSTGSRSGRRIRVNLTNQTLVATQDGQTVRSFIVSTGKPGTPTPVGRFYIGNRYASQTMAGPGYVLPGVPYVQYFYGSYALHGTYWHTAFGVPVSHGCVNLSPEDAEWLWGWASEGTEVVIEE